ncbi:dihydroorotate dehydrogenase (NAD+) catalytic subunit [Elusimicrobium simillimum]|uniref:dihydroorotate dehydrogenase n=1 Tax=Elusimicrobium simillimum TaxID=3143438 RepID=UPI003C703496
MVKTKLGNLELKNPVMSASGTFGYGKEFAEFFDLSVMGAVLCKTITLNQREGNKPPRIADTPYGMLNSIGLENKGVEYFINTALPFLAKYDTKVIASIAGNDAAEYGELAKILDVAKLDAIEVNLSCPNVSHGKSKGLFSQCADTSAAIITAVRAGTHKPIFAKLSAQVTDIKVIAKACENAGADGLTLINTLPAMMVDLKTRRPMLGNIFGGLSGGAIKPVALKAVYEVYKEVSIPIIGSGGIMNAEDALEFILCGASAVQVGSVNFVNPRACEEIVRGIEAYFKENNFKDITELKGQVKI